jgi:L-histidine Nalpha-methyltransferase
MAVQADLRLVEHDKDGIAIAFRADVLRGPAESQNAVPARWLYDLAGSKLFEDLTSVNLGSPGPSRPPTPLVSSARSQLEVANAHR